MKLLPETILTRLINDATSKHATPEQLANSMALTFDRLIGISPVGEEAQAIFRNKVLREHLAAAFTGAAARTSTPTRKLAASEVVARPKRVMSPETKAKLSKSATKRWAERKAVATKAEGGKKAKDNGDSGGGKKSAAVAKAKAIAAKRAANGAHLPAHVS